MDGAVRRGLYSREGHLGEDEPDFVREADVVFFPPLVQELDPRSLPVTLRARPEAAGARYPRVVAPFALPALAPGRRFLEVWIDVWYEVAGARTLQLEPGPENAPRPRVAPGCGPSLEPVSMITHWGQGSAAVRWRFLPAPDVAIAEGDGDVAALIEVPGDTPAIPMLLNCSVMLGRRRLGTDERVEARLRGEYAAFRPLLA